MKIKLIFATLIFGMAAVMSPDMSAQTDSNSQEAKIIRAADFETYRQEAKDGDPEAMRCLAVCLQYGTGCDKDLDAALKWYGRAASHGSHEAQYNLGCMYRDGNMMKQSDTEAAYWFRKAASNGHGLAQVCLARCFEEGKGVLPDNRIAFENYFRAAEQDIPEAQYSLGRMYRDGKGTKANKVKSRKWFEAAAKHNYKDAAEQAAQLK